MASKAEKEHMNAVAEIGCIVCLNEHGVFSLAEIHHVNAYGMGLRSSNYKVLPLCFCHHRTGGYGVAVHAGKRTWEKNFGTESDLLEQVNNILGV